MAEEMGRQDAQESKILAEREALYKSLGYDIDKERRFVLEAAQPIEGRILDAGTGRGYFALLLARAGYRFISFDISQEARDIARLNLRRFGLEDRADFRVENGERLSFADKSFDVIFSVNMVHHLENPYKVTDEFLRVLAPGGKLVVSDFTDRGFAVMEKIHAREGGRHDAGKVRLADIEKYLAGRGFGIRTARTDFQEVLTAARKTNDNFSRQR